MPIYEYVCRSCGDQVALLIRDTSKMPRCPECGSEQLDKQFSAAYMMSSDSRSDERSCVGREGRCEAESCPMAETCPQL